MNISQIFNKSDIDQVSVCTSSDSTVLFFHSIILILEKTFFTELQHFKNGFVVLVHICLGALCVFGIKCLILCTTLQREHPVCSALQKRSHLF